MEVKVGDKFVVMGNNFGRTISGPFKVVKVNKATFALSNLPRTLYNLDSGYERGNSGYSRPRARPYIPEEHNARLRDERLKSWWGDFRRSYPDPDTIEAIKKAVDGMKK